MDFSSAPCPRVTAVSIGTPRGAPFVTTRKYFNPASSYLILFRLILVNRRAARFLLAGFPR
ncbi:hypothetical protein, partial [Streptomyces sp. NPDC059411]|uniref:hypothetical protein n=1 Tax=Streptomyces sp. NPDC059411 TaxID=3346825 RepID=UPI0036C758B5